MQTQAWRLIELLVALRADCGFQAIEITPLDWSLQQYVAQNLALLPQVMADSDIDIDAAIVQLIEAA